MIHKVGEWLHGLFKRRVNTDYRVDSNDGSQLHYSPRKRTLSRYGGKVVSTDDMEPRTKQGPTARLKREIDGV